MLKIIPIEDCYFFDKAVSIPDPNRYLGNKILREVSETRQKLERACVKNPKIVKLCK